MVNLRRPSRETRGAKFSTRYLSLIIAATMALILWAYQKIYFQQASVWLLTLAIILAALAFGLAIMHIVKIWKNRSKN
jgi:uncharacterized membrane protein